MLLVQRRQNAGDDDPGTFEETHSRGRHDESAPGSSLALQLPSWSSPPNVPRCTHEFPSKLVRKLQTRSNCTWFFTDVTAAIVVQSTFTSGLADVFNSSQALQATPETQAPIRLPREEPVVEKRQTRSKLHLVFHWCHCSLRGPVDNHK